MRNKENNLPCPSFHVIWSNGVREKFSGVSKALGLCFVIGDMISFTEARK